MAEGQGGMKSPLGVRTSQFLTSSNRFHNFRSGSRKSQVKMDNHWDRWQYSENYASSLRSRPGRKSGFETVSGRLEIKILHVISQRHALTIDSKVGLGILYLTTSYRVLRHGEVSPAGGELGFRAGAFGRRGDWVGRQPTPVRLSGSSRRDGYSSGPAVQSNGSMIRE